MIISSLIQTILSVPEFHRIGCKLQFTDYNRRSGINNECSPLSHPAPKNSCSFYVTIVCVWSGDVNCFLRYFRAFWDFFSFFPVKGFLMYFYMILHKLSLICHQIVTKSHRVAPNTNQHPRDPASAFHSGPSGHPDDYIHYK